jgi:hypothetical protein
MRLTVYFMLTVSGTIGAIPESNSPEKVAHFTLGRRGERFASHENVNLDSIAELTRQTKERYTQTRAAKGNKLVLRCRSSKSGTAEDHELYSVSPADLVDGRLKACHRPKRRMC